MVKYLVTRRLSNKLEKRTLTREHMKVRYRFFKCPLLIATLVGIVIITFDPCVYADIFTSNGGRNNILRYDERTGEFLGEFIPAGSGGLGLPTGLLIGPDGNLYVCSAGSNLGSILRYDGITGAPLPSPGNTGATFVPPGSGGLTNPMSTGGGLGIVFGPDGNLYVTSGGISAPPESSTVLRFSGTTGEFIDAFVPPGSGGLKGPRGLVFGPDGNVYVNSSTSGPGTVLRYDGMTGAFLDVFVPAGSNPFGVTGSGAPRGLVFGPDRNLYVSYNWGATADLHSSILRYDGTTGAFLDAFVSEGSGGLYDATGVFFGPDDNLYVRSATQQGGLGGPSAVLRYDGTTGTFIDQFVPFQSGGLSCNGPLVFRNTDSTTLAYVSVSRFHISAASTAISGTAFDVMVTALDPNGNIDTNYQGTVTFSTSDPDSGVVLPAGYTFTTGEGGDNGVHTFPGGVTLITSGGQPLTVTDTASGITGSATITVGPGP